MVSRTSGPFKAWVIHGYVGLIQRYVGFDEIIKTRFGSPWNKGYTSRV